MSNVDHAQIASAADFRTASRALKQAHLFDNAARSTLDALAETASDFLVGTGEALVAQDDPVDALYVIARGRARIERASGPNRVPLGYRGPGEVIGESAVLAGSVHGETAFAMEAMEVWRIDAPTAQLHFANDPGLASSFLSLVMARKREVEDRVESMLFRNVEGRLVEFLLAAADRWGVPVAKGTLIAAPITHLEIAQSIGSTRETVTVTLGQLRKAELLDVAGRRLIIANRPALAARR